MTVDRLRVILADDHAVVLAALRMMIERIPGILVVAEARDGREAVAMACTHRPDLVIMDITMKGLNGIEATAQIRAQLPSTRVLILSSNTERESVRRAILSGASGYLAKGGEPGEVATAIAAIARGNSYLSPSISAHVMAGMLGSGGGAATPLDALSARQREVLQLIAEGKGTKEIARTLGVSAKTVETHRTAVMDRLGIRDIPGLVRFAVRHGLVDLHQPGDS